MSLRSKIALALFLAVSVFIGADQVMHRLSFADRFVELDATAARERLLRVKAVMASQLEDLERTARDVEADLFDPAHATIDTGAHLTRSSSEHGLHLVLTFDEAGVVDQHELRDPTTGEPLDLRELPTGQLSPVHPLMRVSDGGELPRGFWVTQRGALLVSARELSIEGHEAVRLIVGRFLDERMLNDLRAASGVRVDVILAQGLALSAEHEAMLTQVVLANGFFLEEVDSETMRAWSIVPGLGEQPAILLRADAPRDHAVLWKELQIYSVTTTMAIAILFPLVILLLLQWIVTGPLSRLTSHAVRIGQVNDLDVRLNLKRRDEIGLLAGEFDRMLDKLAHSREEVVQNARLSGMVETSTGVIHNVGNVLNSMKTSAGISHQTLMDLKLVDLEAVFETLDAHTGDLDEYLKSDARGQHLMRFFSALICDLREETDRARGELGTLSEGVEHIANLIRVLTSSEARAGVIERLDLADQLNSAVELCMLSVAGGMKFEIERSMEELPLVLIDRHKLMEILVNLIRNALQAMQASDEPVHRLTLRLARNGENLVDLEVTDNGVGIAPEDLARVFAQGHSTKPEGRGLGLHLAANSAGEMGGRLTAKSPGLGCGATFILRLPVRIAPVAGASDGQFEGDSSDEAPSLLGAARNQARDDSELALE